MWQKDSGYSYISTRSLYMLASFPGFPTIQFLIDCSMQMVFAPFCILQPIKNWKAWERGYIIILDAYAYNKWVLNKNLKV